MRGRLPLPRQAATTASSFHFTLPALRYSIRTSRSCTSDPCAGRAGAKRQQMPSAPRAAAQPSGTAQPHISPLPPAYSPCLPRKDLPAAQPLPTPRQLRDQQEAVARPAAKQGAKEKPNQRKPQGRLQGSQPARQQLGNHISPSTLHDSGTAAAAQLPARPLPARTAHQQTLSRKICATDVSGVPVLVWRRGKDRPAPAWTPPPPAPQDPDELLQVLRDIETPRRRLVIFKGGGYVMSDLEALIKDQGLERVMRVSNLIRKAHCVLAAPTWSNGRRVNLAEHKAAAAKRGVPFLCVQRLEVRQLLAVLRPVLISKRIVREQPAARQQVHEP